MMDTSSSFLRTLPLPTPSSSTVTEPPSGQKKIYASTSTQSEENYSHAGSDANQPAIVEIEENSGSSSSHSLMNARRMSYFPTALPPARRTSSMAQEIMRRTSVAITDPTAVYDREGRQGSVFQEAHRKFSSVTSNMGSKRVTHAKPVMHMASKITAILDAERAEKNRRMSLGRSAGTGRASVVAQKQEAGVKYFMDENGVIRCDRGQQMEEGDILQFSELEEICAEFTKEADLCKLFMQKNQSRQISVEALSIYESMTRKVNEAYQIQHQQLDVIREQCAGQFEEDIFRLVEDLEKFSEMAIERFAEKLDTQKWEPLRILEAEKEKLRKANNELAKMKYISSRMYNIMKKNDIFLETTNVEWKPEDIRPKSSNIVDEIHKRSAELDAEILDLKKRKQAMEESFESFIQLNHDMIPKFNALFNAGNIINAPSSLMNPGSGGSQSSGSSPSGPATAKASSVPGSGSAGGGGAMSSFGFQATISINYENLLSTFEGLLETSGEAIDSRRHNNNNSNNFRHGSAGISLQPLTSGGGGGGAMKSRSPSIIGPPPPLANEPIKEDSDDYSALSSSLRPRSSVGGQSVSRRKSTVSTSMFNAAAGITEERSYDDGKAIVPKLYPLIRKMSHSIPEPGSAERMKAEIERRHANTLAEMNLALETQMKKLAKERMELKTQWKAKFNAQKRLNNYPKTERVMKRQEGLLKLATDIAIKPTAEIGIQCELKGKTYRSTFLRSAPGSAGSTSNSNSLMQAVLSETVSSADSSLNRIQVDEKPESSLSVHTSKSNNLSATSVVEEEEEEEEEEGFEVSSNLGTRAASGANIRPWSSKNIK